MAFFDVSKPPYNAACDLTADDTVPVQSAVFDAGLSGDADNTIFIPHPGCKMNGGGHGCVGLKGNLTLVGEVVPGEPRTILFSSFVWPPDPTATPPYEGGEGEAVVVFPAGIAANIRIRNLNLYNTATAFRNVHGNGVGVIHQVQAGGTAVDGVVVENCETHTKSHCGVTFTNVQNLIIRDCEIASKNSGIYLAGPGNKGIVLRNVTVNGTDVDQASGEPYDADSMSNGISLRYPSDLTIVNCHVTGRWGQVGINFREVSTDVDVVRCVIDTPADASMQVLGARRVKIVGNAVSGAGGNLPDRGTMVYCQFTRGSDWVCDDLLIDGNSLRDPHPNAPAAYAVNVSGVYQNGGHFTNVVVSNNTVLRTPQGIVVDFTEQDAAGSAAVLTNDIRYRLKPGTGSSPGSGLYVLGMNIPPRTGDTARAVGNTVAYYTAGSSETPGISIDGQASICGNVSIQEEENH